MRAANKSLAKFDLAGIEAAPRGMPQVEVTFDIDANGILHVTAKDKKTGKEQRIEIKAGSGLTEDEIQRMVRDAEANKEDDKKFHELVGTRNKADQLVHATRAAIKEHGGKVPNEIGAIEEALSDLEKVMKGDDKDADRVAHHQARAGRAVAGTPPPRPVRSRAPTPVRSAAAGGGAKNDDVVDAEFTEVKDEKK